MKISLMLRSFWKLNDMVVISIAQLSDIFSIVQLLSICTKAHLHLKCHTFFSKNQIKVSFMLIALAI